MWIVLGAILVVAAAVIARLFLTRRVRAATAERRLAAAARDEDPRSLDRRADAAEAAGDLEAALRLRFRAGLLRLDARGAIVFRPSISTHEVRRKLPPPTSTRWPRPSTTSSTAAARPRPTTSTPRASAGRA